MRTSKTAGSIGISDNNDQEVCSTFACASMLEKKDAQITDGKARSPHQQGGGACSEDDQTVDSNSTIQGSFEKDKLNTDMKLGSAPVLNGLPAHHSTNMIYEHPCESDMANKKELTRDPAHVTKEPGLKYEEKIDSEGLENCVPDPMQHLPIRGNKSARPVSKKLAGTNKNSRNPKSSGANGSAKPKNISNAASTDKPDCTPVKGFRQSYVNFKNPEMAASKGSKLVAPVVSPKPTEVAGRQASRVPSSPLTSFSEFKAVLLGGAATKISVCDLPSSCSRLGEGRVMLSSPATAASVTSAVGSVAAAGQSLQQPPPAASVSSLLPAMSRSLNCEAMASVAGPHSGLISHTNSTGMMQFCAMSGKSVPGITAAVNSLVVDPPQLTAGAGAGSLMLHRLPPLPKPYVVGRQPSFSGVDEPSCGGCAGRNEDVLEASMLPLLHFSQPWVVSSRPLFDRFFTETAVFVPSTSEASPGGGCHASSSSEDDSLDLRGRVVSSNTFSKPSSKGKRQEAGVAKGLTPGQCTLSTDRVDALLPAWSFLTSHLVIPIRDAGRGHGKRPPLWHSRSPSMRESDTEGSHARQPSNLSESTIPLLLRRHFSLYPLALHRFGGLAAGENADYSEVWGPSLICDDRGPDTNPTFFSQRSKGDCDGKGKLSYYQVRVKVCFEVEDFVPLEESLMHFSTPCEAKVASMPASNAADHHAGGIMSKNPSQLLCPVDTDPRFSRHHANQEALQRFAHSRALSAFSLRAQLNDTALRLIAQAPSTPVPMMPPQQPETRESGHEWGVEAGVNPNSFSYLTLDSPQPGADGGIHPIGLAVESEAVLKEDAFAPSSAALAMTLTVLACSTTSVVDNGEGDAARASLELCLAYRALMSVFSGAFILSPHTSRVEFGMCSLGKQWQSALEAGEVPGNGDGGFPSLEVKDWRDIALDELRSYCVLPTHQSSFAAVPSSPPEDTKPSATEPECRSGENVEVTKKEEKHQDECLERHEEANAASKAINEEEHHVGANQLGETSETPKPEEEPVEEKCDLCPDQLSYNLEPGENKFSCEWQKYSEVDATSREGITSSHQGTISEVFTLEKSVEGESKELLEWDVRDMTAGLSEKTQEVCREVEEIQSLIKELHKLYGVSPQLSDELGLGSSLLQEPQLGHSRRSDSADASNTKCSKKSLGDNKITRKDVALYSALVNSLIESHAASLTSKSAEELGKDAPENPDSCPYTFFSNNYRVSPIALIAAVHTVMWNQVKESVETAIPNLNNKDQTTLLQSLFACLSASSSPVTPFPAYWASHHGEPLLRRLRRDLFNLSDHSLLQSDCFVDDSTLTSFSEAVGERRAGGGAGAAAGIAAAPSPPGAVIKEQVLGSKLRQSGRKNETHSNRAGPASAAASHTRKSGELLFLPALNMVTAITAGISSVSPAFQSSIPSQNLWKPLEFPSEVGNYRLVFKSSEALSKAKSRLQETVESLQHWLVTLQGVRERLQWGVSTLLKELMMPFLSKRMSIIWEGCQGLWELYARSLSTRAMLRESEANRDCIVRRKSSIEGVEELGEIIDVSDISIDNLNDTEELLSFSHIAGHSKVECTQLEGGSLSKSLSPERNRVSRGSSFQVTSFPKMHARQKKKGVEAHKQQVLNRHSSNSVKLQKHISVEEERSVSSLVQGRGCPPDGVTVLKAANSSEKGPMCAVNAKSAGSKTVPRKQGTHKVSPNARETDITTSLVLPFIIVGALLLMVLLWI